MPRDDEFDDEDRPRRPRNSRDDEDDRPRRRRDPEDDYDDTPGRSGGAPHRGGMILTFGILSLLCCPLIFGILAIVMGGNDLKAMAAGRMDRSGEGLTRVGQILGFVGIGLWILLTILRLVVIAANK
ncbi:MAG TPA: DUF4190 domain-containing protein [Gemmataceae bacterium]|nr:DUF4190 domain-containing protein [Gemmataceae bacterium]